MTYKDKLFPWCIINPRPGLHTRIVGRFRSRSDAEGHLQLLRRLIPHLHFEIMFDVPIEHSQSPQTKIEKARP